jgi:ABC-2 type transport system ATP-binding protein
MHALSVRRLSKRYANGVEALKAVDVDVERGDFFGLLGPNGAGKSTLIGIVTSLVIKSGGEVRVFGHDLDRELEAAKACIGVVPQEFNFNPFEPVEDIVVNQAGYYGIPRREARARARTQLGQLQLWDRRREPANRLSGGMKRRLMIARALIHAPRLLILDEPTAGVDIEIRRSMWSFLREINAQGTTIILTTHYLEEAESLCRTIAIIDDGRIIEHASTRELLGKLQTQTFVVDVRERLQQPPVVAGYAIRVVDPNSLEVEVARDRPLNALFTALSEAGVDVVSMRNKVNRLEELFVKLVEEERYGPRDPGDRPGYDERTLP